MEFRLIVVRAKKTFSKSSDAGEKIDDRKASHLSSR